MKGLIDFVIAFVVIWLGLFGYMVYLNIKQRRLMKEVSVLKETLDKHGKQE